MTGRQISSILHAIARGRELGAVTDGLHATRGAWLGSVLGDRGAGALPQLMGGCPPPGHLEQAAEPIPGSGIKACRAGTTTLACLAGSTSHPTSVASSLAAVATFAAPCGHSLSTSTVGFATRALTSAPEAFSAGGSGQDHQQQHVDSGAAEGRASELGVARSNLLESLELCLGLHSLDALLARDWDPAVYDELVLLRLLDTAHYLCNTSSASNAVPLAASGVSVPTKSPTEAAADVLTRLSELLILRLSEGTDALSPEGAVRALRTLAAMRFNPAGDYKGLMTMADFYRVSVLPGLKAAQAADPSLAARMPQLLIDLFFAFSRLFDVAARREREVQVQLQAAQVAEEDAAARRAADEEASGGVQPSGSGAGLPPWQRESSLGGPSAEALSGALGHRQLYHELARALSDPGMLSSVPSKSLGTLATALAAAHFPHQLAQTIATQTLLRLQGGSAGNAAVLAGIRVDAAPTGLDAMATSTLSNILSSLAKLGFEHETLCDAIANWMRQRLGGASVSYGSGAAGPMSGASGGGVAAKVEPHHIVDVAVAFARLKYDNMDYMQRAASVLQRKLPQTSPNSVAMMTWALANSKSGRSEDMNTFLEALASRMVSLHRYTMSGPGAGSGSGSMLVVPRHLACMTLALAKLQKNQQRLGTQQLRLLDAVVDDVVKRADSYQARQLCSILYSFVTFDYKRPELFDAACAVLEPRLRAVARQPPGTLPPSPAFVFGPHNYSDLAFSVAMSGYSANFPGLMEHLADRVVDTAQSMGKACLVRTAQAFAVAEPAAYTPKVFDAIAQAIQPHLSDLGPAFIGLLVEAYTEVQHPVTGEFWKACMDAAGLKVPYMDRPRQDMHEAAVRLVSGFQRHPATQTLPQCRGHYVLPMLEEISKQHHAGFEEEGLAAWPRGP